MIDKSGQWWVGDSPADLDPFMMAYSAGGYEVQRTAPSACGQCGGRVFRLAVDDEEGFASRSCVGCQTRFALLDSGEYEADATAEDCACPCGGEEFHLAVGFALRTDGDVRWVSIGGRCVKCGVLGCYADWKIDYSPTDQLFGLI